MKEVIEKINALKKEKNALILGHTYTHPEVQDISDYVGDSYGLSKKAAESGNYDIIVFAGVQFMAETAKILSPQTKVLLPVLEAGCPMADMINEDQLKAFKAEHPDAAVVCYVNSDVRTKALSDVCVTSSNAVKIVKKLENKKILFVPDQHLGSYVAEQVPEKEVICWEGYCPVHNKVGAEDVVRAKKLFPGYTVIMHPECPAETRKEADYVLSTGQMVELVAQKKFRKYIVVTEAGITYGLQKEDPEAEFIDMSEPAMRCKNMKKIMLTDILYALEKEQFSIEVEKEVSDRAIVSLQRMLDLAK